MSYGLLTTLAGIIGHADNIPMVALDNELRDKVVKELIADRTKSGRVETEYEIADVELTPSQVVQLLEWASEHVLDFFLKVLASANKLGKKVDEKVKALMPDLESSQTGTPA